MARLHRGFPVVNHESGHIVTIVVPTYDITAEGAKKTQLYFTQAAAVSQIVLQGSYNIESGGHDNHVKG